MSVVIDFEEAGPWRKRMTIEVPAPAVEAEAGRVAKELSRSVSIPGFRKGKVPPSIIQKRFAHEIEHRVAERLVPRYLHQAEAEKSLDVLTQPQVEDVRFEVGAPMTFVAVVETRPEIELRNVEDFTLPEADVEPADDEVAQALTDMRRRYRTWTEVDRPAATGDLVQGEVVAVSAEDGESEDGAAEPRPLRIEIGAAGVDEELSLSLTGLKAGQSTTFKRTEGQGGEAVEREYRIEVTSVEEEELPDLDDELAVKMGATDAETVREDMASHLRQIKKMELDQRREAALLEQLRARHPLEPPRGIVDQRVERMMHEQASRLASQGVDLENAGIDWQAMGEQLRPEALKRVHSSLLLDAIAKAKDIKLDEAEFERVLSSIAREQKKSSLAVRQELDATGRLPLLRADLLERQTVRHLLREETGEAEESGGAEGGPAEGGPDEGGPDEGGPDEG